MVLWRLSGSEMVSEIFHIRSLEISTAGEITPESIRIKLDEEGKGKLSWRGRAWKQVSIVLKTSDPVQVTSQIDGVPRVFSLDAPANPVNEIVLPVKTRLFFQAINLLLLPFIFITVGYFLFLIFLIFQDPLNLARFIPGGAQKVTHKTVEKWFWVLTTMVYGLIAVTIIATGFNNRLYMDDFCYLNIFHRNGFFGAITNNFREVNGRFASHVLNFVSDLIGQGQLAHWAIDSISGCGREPLFLHHAVGPSPAKWKCRYIKEKINRNYFFHNHISNHISDGAFAI